MKHADGREKQKAVVGLGGRRIIDPSDLPLH